MAATTPTSRLTYAQIAAGTKPAAASEAMDSPKPVAASAAEAVEMSPEEAALARLDAIAATLPKESRLMAELAASKLFRNLVKAYALVLSYRARGVVAALLREAKSALEDARLAMTVGCMVQLAAFKIVSPTTGKLTGETLQAPAVAFLSDRVFPHRTSWSSTSPMENDTAAFIKLLAAVFPEAFPKETLITICVGDEDCTERIDFGHDCEGFPVNVFSLTHDGQVLFGRPMITFVWKEVPDYVVRRT